VLVERERELGFLERLADTVEAGRSQLVVLSGEAGIGKTRLAQELVELVRERWTVMPLVIESGVPVPATSRAAAPATGSAGSALATAVVELDGGRGSSTPVLLVLEDAERLDPAGVEALGAVLDQLAESRLLVLAQLRVGTHRPGSDDAGAMARLLRRPDAHEVALGPLSEQGLAAMANALGHDLDDVALAALFSRTAGNAFFSEEILLASDEAVPWTVADAVMRRLQVLRPAVREAASVLAVADAPLPRPTLEMMVRDPSAGSDLLDAGIARHAPGGDVVLRHALVGEVVSGRLSGPDRQRISRMLAETLEGTDVPPERLVRHWSEAGEPDRAAAHAAVAARRAAGRDAYLTATELYRVALERPPHERLPRAELLEAAATAAGSAGLAGDALSWANAADACYRQLAMTGRAVAMWLQPGLRLVPKPPIDAAQLPEDQIERLLEDARAAARERRHDASAQLARRALEVAANSGADVGLAVQAARRLMSAGELAEGEAHLERLRTLAAGTGDSAGLAKVSGQLSIVAMARHDLHRCLALNQQALELVEGDHQSGAWAYEGGIAIALVYMGDLDEAQIWVDRLIGLGSPIVTEIAQLPACVIDVERGDLDQVAARLDRLAAVTQLEIDEYTAAVLLLKARWSLDSGDPEGAMSALDEAARVAGERFETSLIERLYWLTRAAGAVDDDATIADARDALVEQVSIGVGPGAEAAVAWIDGYGDARDGRHDAAVARFAEAATAWERLGRYALSAEVWLDAATSLIVSGTDGREARAALQQVDRLARPRGLLRIERRRDAVVATSAGSTRGHGKLTPRERQIAELVATGKTNREIAETLFLSEHTIRNQLVHIFDKLNVSRRAELAARVTDPDWPDQ
jgi:DNA-binding CsgD family transcriptional regulator